LRHRDTYLVAMRHALARTFLLAVLALATVPTGVGAQTPIPLGEISRYINSLTKAKAEFTQLNADGSISTGTLYLHRPGRARFEYDPPEPALVIAGGGTLAIFDRKSNQPPEQYPLRRTPLSVILERNVDLSRAGMVTGHRAEGNTTIVTAQDPESPEAGAIRLVFTAGPVELRQWVIVGQDGSETTVVLGELLRDVELTSFLFNIPLEVDRILGRN